MGLDTTDRGLSVDVKAGHNRLGDRGSPIEASAGADKPSEDANPYMQRFAVEFAYPVWFTHGLFNVGNLALRSALTRHESDRRHRLVCLVDHGVARGHPHICSDIHRYVDAHADVMDLCTPPTVVGGGERGKTDPAVLDSVLTLIRRNGLDRQSFVVAVGGGALLDVVGYAAAITHRGVRLIRAPSTVLAQNDAGIGVKNGVNAFDQKNYLGTFVPPSAVINDLDLLNSLEPRDRRAGMAEAVKVALIRDAEFFSWIDQQADALAIFNGAAVEKLVRRCAELHLRHIATSGDPFEFGSARPLDFGHWIAHKLESLTGHALRHGEAVAIGIALDSRYSVEAGLLEEDAQIRIQTILETLGFRLWDDALDLLEADGTPAWRAGLDEFREHLGGTLTLTMLTAIGRGLEINAVDSNLISAAIEWLHRRDVARCDWTTRRAAI